MTKVSIPSGAIKRRIGRCIGKCVQQFQFLLVQLRDEAQFQGIISGLSFQFLLVQLRAFQLVTLNGLKEVSIPSGAIKRFSRSIVGALIFCFNSFWCN